VSTEPGGKGWGDEAVRAAKALVEAPAAVPEQLQFLPTPEDMAEAQHAVRQRTRGDISQRDVLSEARGRGGRKAGSRNRRTDDFSRWILSHGQHPAVTLMQIQATPPEVLVERSAAMDPVKRRMSYDDAQSLRVRCADILLPYIEGKKPIAIDLNAKGDFNLLIPGVNIAPEDAQAAADGQFMLDAEFTEYLPDDGKDGSHE
jgi:hypothetical protein